MATATAERKAKKETPRRTPKDGASRSRGSGVRARAPRKAKEAPSATEPQEAAVSATEASEAGNGLSGKAKDRASTPRRAAAGETAPREGRKPRGVRNKELGRRGEEAAARFLVHRGYEILERNWECCAGEADIIARDERVLVFVEVKTRSDSSMGFPAEAVTAKKRERYERIACLYLQDHDLSDMMVRFDVISLVAIAQDRALIRHHINAWSEADK